MLDRRDRYTIYEETAWRYGLTRAQAVLVVENGLQAEPSKTLPTDPQTRKSLLSLANLLDNLNSKKWEQLELPGRERPLIDERFDDLVLTDKIEDPRTAQISEAFESAARMAYLVNRMRREPNEGNIRLLATDKPIDEACKAAGLAVSEIIHQKELLKLESPVYKFPNENYFRLFDPENTELALVAPSTRTLEHNRGRIRDLTKAQVIGSVLTIVSGFSLVGGGLMMAGTGVLERDPVSTGIGTALILSAYGLSMYHARRPWMRKLKNGARSVYDYQ